MTDLDGGLERALVMKMARKHLASCVYRWLYPESRIPYGHTVRYAPRPTASTRARECVLCGAQCPGWSRRWARKRDSLIWEIEHDCAQSYLVTHGFESPGQYDLGVSLSAVIVLGDRDPSGAVAVLHDLIEELARNPTS